MIKAIIFDVGGVIVNTSALFDNLVDIFKPQDNDKFWILLNEKLAPLCRNEISEQEFWNDMVSVTGTSKSRIPKDFWAKYSEKFLSVNNDVLKIAKELKSGYRIGIISNSIAAQADLNSELGIYDDFDSVILSHEIGITKDSKEIFILASNNLGVKTNQCLFIDDVKRCVDVAESVGMKGILFKNAKELRDELTSLLKQQVSAK